MPGYIENHSEYSTFVWGRNNGVPVNTVLFFFFFRSKIVLVVTVRSLSIHTSQLEPKSSEDEPATCQILTFFHIPLKCGTMEYGEVSTYKHFIMSSIKELEV